MREEVKDELVLKNSPHIASNLRGRSYRGVFENRIYMRNRNDPILSTTENKSTRFDDSSLFSEEKQKYFDPRFK